MFEQEWEEVDANRTQVSRAEMFWERKIKSTGERVGGAEYVQATRKTVAQTRRESPELLKHWIALQRRTYRQVPALNSKP